MIARSQFRSEVNDAISPRMVALALLPVIVAIVFAALIWVPVVAAVIAVAAFTVISLISPAAALLALIPLTAFDIYLGGVFISQLCTMSLIVGTAVHLYWSRKPIPIDRFFLIPILLLVGCILPLTFASSRVEVLKYVLKFGGFVGIFVVARIYGGSELFVRRFVTMLAVAASLAALYGIWQSVSQGTVVWIEQVLNLTPAVSMIDESSIFRPYGTFRYVLEFALYLHMSACVLVPWVLVRRRFGSVSVWFVFAALSVVTALALTIARGAWVAFAVSMFLAFGWVLRKKWIAFTLIGCLVVAAGLYGSTFEITDLTGSVADINVDIMRFQLWSEGARIIAGSPFFGVGPGNLQFVLPPIPVWGELQPVKSLENLYLTWMAQSGIPAAIVLVVFFVSLIVFGLRGWKSTRSPGIRAVQLGIAMAITGVLINGLTDPILHSSQTGTLLFLLCGIQRSLTDPNPQAPLVMSTGG
jgi:hypothetical protein